MDMTNENLQNEVEHLRAVCAQQDDRIDWLCERNERFRVELDERLNSLDDLSVAYDALRAELADNLFHDLVVAASTEISQLKARIDRYEQASVENDEAWRTRYRYLQDIIKQMLAETGHGGNKSCGDNRLTPETIARAKGAI